MIGRILLFLLINFGALALGGYFTGAGVPSEWYESLNKAPWTPPGWVFGAAWTTIMIALSVYMAFAVKAVQGLKFFILLYAIQWILNVAWNPVFFYFQWVLFGLFIIAALTGLVAFLMFSYRSALKAKSLLLLPYLIWLCIATSLNAYIYFMN